MTSRSYAFVALVLLASACPQQPAATSSTTKPAAPKQGTPLAKVGDETITVEEFAERINAQGPFARPRFQDPARRKEFLEALIRQELLAQEAVRRGYDQDPEVQDALKKVMVQKLTRAEYDSRVKQEDVKAEEIQAYYDAHPEEFHKPEMVRCSGVLLTYGPDAQSKEAARKRAEAALQKIRASMSKKPQPGQPVPPDVFRDVVMSISEDAETKQLGGDLRYLSRAELDEKYGPALGEACFNLANVNDVSGVVAGKNGWWILKNTGRRKPIDRTLQQVETQIRNRLFREKRAEAFNTFVDSLKQKSPVTVDEAKLGTMEIAGGAPRGPNTLPPPRDLAPGTGEAQFGPGETSPDPHGH